MNAAEIARRKLDRIADLRRLDEGDITNSSLTLGIVEAEILCRAVLDAEAQDHSGCQYSTGICGSITAGRGKLDENGYFEFPCASCARIANLEEHLRALQCVHEAYRARVKGVVREMLAVATDDMPLNVRGIPTVYADIRRWAAQLTEKGDG